MRALAALTLVLLSGCIGASPGASTPPAALASSASPSASTVPAVSGPPKATPPPLTFATTAQQARMVATVVALLDAFNSGRVDVALAFLTDDVAISDCDYRAVHVTLANGAEAARQWLRDRAADHDQLVLESVRNENPDPSTGAHVVAVAYARRTSDTLRALGFPNGINPQAATKVVFTATDDRIRAFANGPFGGPSELCRPTV